ncbi:hypothetical protein [Demequina activiva]|uniref:Uncharacterized protein n=1 Tax=Demequina activiva TaxID=1582364 RepID=A0A919Q2Q8_9MICO|nr:hypothetical protein [Demequina activiva]GIG55170.1 hypothetical protein Dac01nite_19220 [Demequina activiva]
MSTKASPLIAKAAAFVAGAAAASVLAAIAYAAGYDSVSKGMIQGASVMLGIILILWIVGPRLGLGSRVANGVADERDDRILTAAFADSAVGMGLAAVGAMVGSFYGLPGVAVAGIVLWVGVLTFSASAVVRSRRS